MKTIRLTTIIAAPAERVFQLSTSVNLHLDSARHTHETVIDGRTAGELRKGETVTWRGRHFGWMFTHKSLIEELRPHSYFRDAMVEGAFRSFVHEHHFAPFNDGTRMRDIVRFAAPFGPAGRLAERLLLERHLVRFLRRRNAMLKQIAESPEAWQHYLQSGSRLQEPRKHVLNQAAI